jgi:hypothetical protein
MPRQSYQIAHNPGRTNTSGVTGVTKELKPSGRIKWRAWGTDGGGKTICLYTGPSQDDAITARRKWEEEIDHGNHDE